MKKVFIIFFLGGILLVMTGCPVGISFPPGEPGTEKIDEKLLGTWITRNVEHEIQKVKIEKNDKNSYNIKVLEKGSMYSIESDELVGWVTEIKAKKFIYAKPSGEENYYTYCYETTGSGFKTWDSSLKVGGVDAVTSTEAYRQEIIASMEFEDFLTGETEWTK